jgi:S-DNA-T family DNA segregation ATPase FtsK/SpoIIIE
MDITPRARHFLGVTLGAVAAFLVVAFMTASPFDWPFDRAESLAGVRNLSGPLGSVLAWVTFGLLGRVFAWLIPFILAGLAVCTVTGGFASLRRWAWKASASVVLLNAFFALAPVTRDIGALRGSLGDTLASGLAAVFGEIGGTIIVVAGFLLVVLGELGRLLGAAAGLPRRVSSRLASGRSLVDGLRMVFMRRVERIRTYLDELRHHEDEIEVRAPEINPEPPAPAQTAERWEEPQSLTRPPLEVSGAAEAPPRPRSAAPKPKPRTVKPDIDEADKPPLSQASLPPLTILDRSHEKVATYSHEELRNWSTVLEEKLINYGVEGKVTAVHHGPVVTTFEFEPAPGVRIKEIVNRSDDLALAMRARSLRMIAPIPGRACVGIEIPNPKSRMVYLHDVLDEVTEKQRLAGVMLAIGVDVVGHPFVMNLCEAPHLLIAGTTGSGKSVCINAMIASILLQYRPSDVKLILVDPKIVEMSMYNGIPHLLHPVITDPKEAARALEYLVAEMHRRNELFRKHGVRNLESFNTKVAMEKPEPGEEPPQRLPYIVVIVDELGDLALAKGVDIESLLARLAQMARAAGIHMVLATQRPSVDVIVGKTKANFPTRIAFRVATKVDSRTIIDTVGADKLLGKGDMLYMDALNPMPLRVHGAWVSEREIEDLIAHWKSFRFDDDELELDGGRAGGAAIDDDVDPLFEDAKGVVFQYKQGSTSLLQRKLHIGYARAARVLDQLEQRGIVGPPDGSKPREVYMDAIEMSGEE